MNRLITPPKIVGATQKLAPRMSSKFTAYVIGLVGAALLWCPHGHAALTVGSKSFTESYLLGEIMAQVIEDAGETTAERKFGLGGTGIVVESLKSGSIDLYVEYTGTITETILPERKQADYKTIQKALEAQGLTAGERLGFNNTYALAVKSDSSLQKISDLRLNPNVPAGFSHEYMNRSDGFGALMKHYGLALKNVVAMEHSLTYQSLSEGKIDLIEVWSTDAKILKYGLRLLVDDRDFFPKYDAVILSRKGLIEKYPKSFAALKKLEGGISQQKMTELNAKVEIEGWSFERTANYFLNKKQQSGTGFGDSFMKQTREHINLVFISLLFSTLIGIPIGLLCVRYRTLGQITLAGIGLVQTIPSLALLCFLIPVFGIGYKPAVIALFLYALLPIVRNTYLGFKSIDPHLIESARSLALSKFDRVLRVELPLASPAILSGMQISGVTNVGTATLAAFVGAGGYGTSIATGLALNDNHLILQGAIPAAVLALLVHGLFELANRFLIPRGLRN